ncbi:MAG: hypothetical protein JAY99_15200 [Candidatus Thiodiazotropha lotti]|nr:hypothetical protein [Candidatus Thiodiazotropha lotti]MCG8000865.1 hypothetical protein [Candidatus Thiodiazotropha lotti]MCW4185349.1 hypothetical protein [Candidatus Thiodiazotropha weberae]MCW4192638.1 hypothetical protein [Candidatus Thiodiazotropha weberae]
MLFPPKYFMPGSILATTLLFFCPILAIAADASRILIIHSYSQEYPWTKGQHEGFIDGLQKEQPAQTIIKTEYLDSKRTDYNNSYADWFEQYLQIKYQDFRPDVIYVTDDNGLNFGLTHLVNLFPETPLVFSGVNDYSIQEKLDPALQTGVFEKRKSALTWNWCNSCSASLIRFSSLGTTPTPTRRSSVNCEKNCQQRNSRKRFF